MQWWHSADMRVRGFGAVIRATRFDARAPASSGSVCRALLLAGGRLPQFDLVPFGIDDPSKLSILGVVNLLQYVAAFFAQSFDQRVEILDAVIDHEGGAARRKLVTLRRTNGPDGGSGNGLSFAVGPSERCATPFLDFNSKMFFVPSL